MDTLPTTRKLDIIKSLKQDLSLPTKNYFVKNAASIRLCYFKHTVRGHAIKYITLASVEQVAIFLKEQGVITKYDWVDGEIVMIRKRIITPRVLGPFTQLSEDVVYAWDDITMTESEVLHYAALNEYEQAGGKLGMFISNIFGKKKGNRAA